MYGKDIERWLKMLKTFGDECYKATQIIISTTETEDGQRPQMIPHWHIWPTTNFSTGSGGAGDSSHSHSIPVDKTSTEITNGKDGKIWEQAAPCPTLPFMATIRQEFQKVKAELDVVRTINKKLYVNNKEMHNSNGSPYEELYAIEALFIEMNTYTLSHQNLDYIGEKVIMFFYLQSMLTRIMEAKFALIVYFDNLQRGYDAVINGGKASITWAEFDKR